MNIYYGLMLCWTFLNFPFRRNCVLCLDERQTQSVLLYLIESSHRVNIDVLLKRCGNNQPKLLIITNK